MTTLSTTGNSQSKTCKSDVSRLSQSEVEHLLTQLDGWQADEKSIRKTYSFKNYYQTIAFVNAVAWMTHREDHHPQLTVGYNDCVIEYSTHSVDGLSENDFICAEKVDSLLNI